MSKTMSKAEAAIILEDEIYDLKETAEKCSVIMREIMDGYFEKYNPSGKDAVSYIALDFKRIGTFASILDDIILNLNKDIDKIDSLSDEKESKIKTGGNAA